MEDELINSVIFLKFLCGVKIHFLNLNIGMLILKDSLASIK